MPLHEAGHSQLSYAMYSKGLKGALSSTTI